MSHWRKKEKNAGGTQPVSNSGSAGIEEGLARTKALLWQACVAYVPPRKKQAPLARYNRLQHYREFRFDTHCISGSVAQFFGQIL
jgi:hypothetical protein